MAPAPPLPIARPCCKPSARSRTTWLRAQNTARNTNRSRASEGYVTYLDQLDAQRNLLAAELSLVQSRLDRLDATIGLMQVLGGGWAPP
jgi:multidrug efflux system outer membrane protein